MLFILRDAAAFETPLRGSSRWGLADPSEQSDSVPTVKKRDRGQMVGTALRAFAHPTNLVMAPGYRSTTT